jgi:hypothetical protein
LLSIALLLLTNTFITEVRAVSGLDARGGGICRVLSGLRPRSLLAPRRWLLASPVAVGFCLRGPIGLVIPTGMLCSYFLLNRQWRAFSASA